MSTQKALLITALCLAAASCDDDGGLRHDPECMRSMCRTEGWCTYKKGTFGCVPEGDDCAQSTQCKTHGRCQPAGDGSRICRAASDADCRQSAACHASGACRFAGGGCRFDSTWQGTPSCAGSWMCIEYGHCAGTHPTCELGAEGCAASAVCKKSGWCALTERGCFATSEGHCRSSDACHDYGICTLFAPTNLCIADSDADCRASWACRALGACILGERAATTPMRCVVGFAADCEASYACRDEGRCKLAGDPAAGNAKCSR